MLKLRTLFRSGSSAFRGRPALTSTAFTPHRRCLSLCPPRLCVAAPTPPPDESPAAGQTSEQQQHHQGGAGDGERASAHRLRSRVLEASLLFVSEFGWSVETLAAGSESLGLPDAAHGMFPRGGVELVEHFYRSCNAELVRQMTERRASEQAEHGPAPLGSQAFIRWAVEARLRMVSPYLAQWPEALSLLALPHNAANSLANFGALLDDVWHFAGDRSSDFNWYTKRLILAGVYKTTELRLLTDTSSDFAETWSFLERRLEDAVRTGRAARRLREAAPQAANSAAVLLTSVCNMVGLNARR